MNARPYLAAAERKAEQIRPQNAQAADLLLMAARQRKSGEATRNRGRIQLLTVCASTHPTNPAYAQPMRDAVAALDLGALAALLN